MRPALDRDTRAGLQRGNEFFDRVAANTNWRTEHDGYRIRSFRDILDLVIDFAHSYDHALL